MHSRGLISDMESSPRLRKTSKKKSQAKRLTPDVHRTIDVLCGGLNIVDREEGVWLPASKLQQLLSAIPPVAQQKKQDTSDSSSSDNYLLDEVQYGSGSTINEPSSSKDKSLPPMGVFWDIENCQVPSGVSALSVVQMVRDKFLCGYREAEFVVVCDVTKENPQIIQELNAAQIDLIHVASICKNAADEKLRQSLRRFGEVHGSPSAAILMSGDINFAADLSDLRHRKKIKVILLHQHNTSEALILCSDLHYDYLELTKELPHRSFGKGVVSSPQPMEVIVTNLPDVPVSKTKSRLRLLSANCGGRVISVVNNEAVLRFSSAESALRARVRMEGEDVHGCKIRIGFPQPMRFTPNSEVAGRQYSPQTVINSPYSSNLASQLGLVASPSSWPQVLQTPSQFVPRAVEPSLVSTQYQQTGVRSIRGRQDQSCVDEQSYETSLSAVSSWFHPGLLPPPQITTFNIQMPPPRHRENTRSPSPMYSPFPVRADADGSESFQPIQTPLDPSAVSSPVDLQVSNLDHSLDQKEMRRLLLAAFKEHVMVLQLSVYTQSDGQLSARVRVPSRQDAQVAVASLHRQLIGNRRIRISIPTLGGRSGSVSPSAQIVKAQVASLLKEVPGQKLPLFKLCELYEKRFLTSVSLSELHRMRDVLNICEEPGRGRVVNLLPEVYRSATPSFSDMAFAALQDGQLPELPYCPIHAMGDTGGTGWAEKTLQPLPNVNINLSALSQGLYELLKSHQGALPLYSLPLCYEAEVRPLPSDDKGVPLEHLVTWIKGVILKSSPHGGCAKMLTWGVNTQYTPSTASEDSTCSEITAERSTSPAQLAAQVTLFGREVVELLRASPRCQLLFIKFIPAYHHHFGRQCRVANYGFTRLIDLLDALPSVVQVIGEADSRIVILAQAAQIRRFTSDLLRVLKAQPNKNATLSELPELFTKSMSRPFDAVDYGLCDISDLVARVPQNTVVVTPPVKEGCNLQPNALLSLPKRDQTQEEIERTKHFAKEVVGLLRDAPQCAIPFNKFIPAYHHHFGHQCRLSDYGVNKLAELLAAVSDVVQMEEVAGGDRRVTLALPERQMVLGEQIRTLIQNSPDNKLLLSQLSGVYQRQHGVALDPPTYGAATTFELINRLSKFVQIIPSDRGPLLRPVRQLHNLPLRLLKVLFDAREYRMHLSELKNTFQLQYGETLNAEDVKQFGRMVYFADGEVALTTLYVAAARIRSVIKEQGGNCPLGNIFNLYMLHWGRPFNPAEFGHSSLPALLSDLSDVFFVTGRGKKRNVSLRENVNPKDDTPIYGVSRTKPATLSSSSTSSSGGTEDQGACYLSWGSLMPTPNININTKNDGSRNKPSNSPWIGQLWGLHAQNVDKENVWSDLNTPMKLWSPPKTVKNITAPDPSELPMPSIGLLQALPKQDGQDMLRGDQFVSDFGVFPHAEQSTTPSPSLPSRRRRLAAHFSSPIEQL